MKNKKICITIIVILVILLAIIAMLLINNSKNKTPSSCNYNDSNKTYINRDSNCVINFLCIQGKTAFSDECGCGCKSV